MTLGPVALFSLSSPTALQGFLDAAPDSIVVVDRAGRVVMVNGLTERMFHYPRGELIGQPVELLVPERYWRLHADERSRYFVEPRTRPMGEGRALCGRRRDGTEFTVEISLSPLHTEEGPLVISIIRDTTHRRQAEAKFRGLLESAPDGMVVLDRTGKIVIVNGQTESIFGYPRDELIGQPIEVLIPERYRSIHAAHRNGYFGSPNTRPMGGAAAALTGRRRDATEFPVEVSLSPMHTEEGLLVTAAIRDITERKQAENQLRSSLKEKEVLLKEVHHRVKNNLQIVSSMLNLQMDQIADEQAFGLFQESQARVRSIALFHEKLYQSKDLAHVDTAEYLEGITTGLFTTYGVDPDRIVLSVETEDVPLGVDAAICCGLIVNELVSNSLKHAFREGRRGVVHVGLRRDGPLAVLEVADDGVGFSGDLDVRNPSTLTLGLRLLCFMTEQIRGTIELDRSRGTRFVIRFERGEHE